MNDIESLFKHGVVSVLFGKKEASFFVQVKQGISTGGVGNFAAVDHQATGETVEECLEKIAPQVKEAESSLFQETRIVVPRSN